MVVGRCEETFGRGSESSSLWWGDAFIQGQPGSEANSEGLSPIRCEGHRWLSKGPGRLSRIYERNCKVSEGSGPGAGQREVTGLGTVYKSPRVVQPTQPAVGPRDFWRSFLRQSRNCVVSCRRGEARASRLCGPPGTHSQGSLCQSLAWLPQNWSRKQSTQPLGHEEEAWADTAPHPTSSLVTLPPQSRPRGAHPQAAPPGRPQAHPPPGPSQGAACLSADDDLRRLPAQRFLLPQLLQPPGPAGGGCVPGVHEA